MKRILISFVLTTGLMSSPLAIAGESASKEVKKGKPMNQLDVSKISDKKVQSAMQAWQAQDLKVWLEHFQKDAKLFDDGNPRDFQGFSREITEEWFTAIDKVEESGTKITGQFQTKKWGSFRVYFKFHKADDGKFSRLDIGQAGK